MKSSLRYLAALLVLFIYFPQLSSADEVKIPLSATESREVKDILANIKNSNPPQNGALRYRTGLMQLLINVPSNLNLGVDNTLPIVGLEGYQNIVRGFGIEAQYFYAQNFLRSTNQQAKIDFLNVGPRFTFYLDETRLSDYFALKVFYHKSSNNIGTASTFLINDYTGYALSIERGIPASKNFGVIASLDMLSIQTAKSVSTIDNVANDGYGFTIRGEAYYQVDWFSFPARLGISYWQQSYANKLAYHPAPAAGQTATGFRANEFKDSIFQVSRAIWASLTFLY